MSNLVSSFIKTVERGGTLAEAIREMDAALGTSYTHSRLRQWERGDRDPTPRAMNYMLSVVLPARLAREGLSQKRAASILKECSLP